MLHRAILYDSRVKNVQTHGLAKNLINIIIKGADTDFYVSALFNNYNDRGEKQLGSVGKI